MVRRCLLRHFLKRLTCYTSSWACRSCGLKVMFLARFLPCLTLLKRCNCSSQPNLPPWDGTVLRTTHLLLVSLPPSPFSWSKDNWALADIREQLEELSLAVFLQS